MTQEALKQDGAKLTKAEQAVLQYKKTVDNIWVNVGAWVVTLGLIYMFFSYAINWMDNLEPEDYRYKSISDSLTMSDCLSKIQKATDSVGFRILTDTPKEVFGELPNGKDTFNCVRRTTGTRGTYYEGWYSNRK